MNLTLIILLLLQENSSISLKVFLSHNKKEQDTDSTFELSPTHLLIYIIIVHDKF